MTPSGHFWGDTLTQQRISVYRLKQPIIWMMTKIYTPPPRCPTESTPLLSFTFTPRPGQKRELEIRLPDELGKELLTDLIAEEDYFDSQDKFKENFPDWPSWPKATEDVS